MYRMLSISLILFLSGCSTILGYVNRDANENEVQLHAGDQGASSRGGPHKFSVVAFTAGRRAIAVTTAARVEEDSIIFCAEPPPDAMTSFLASDAVSAAVKKSGVEGQAAIESTFKIASSSIASRTPLVEIYRAAVYSLCQMYANNAIDPQNFVSMFNAVTKDVVAKVDGAITPGASSVVDVDVTKPECKDDPMHAGCLLKATEGAKEGEDKDEKTPKEQPPTDPIAAK